MLQSFNSLKSEIKIKQEQKHKTRCPYIYDKKNRKSVHSQSHNQCRAEGKQTRVDRDDNEHISGTFDAGAVLFMCRSRCGVLLCGVARGEAITCNFTDNCQLCVARNFTVTGSCGILIQVNCTRDNAGRAISTTCQVPFCYT